MPPFTQNFGRQIVREIYGKTAWGIFKGKVSYSITWVLWGGSVSVFVVAGVLSANAVLGFNY